MSTLSLSQSQIIATQQYLTALNRLDSSIPQHNPLIKHLKPFATYKRQTIDCRLQYVNAEHLSDADRNTIFNITKHNMYELYNQCSDRKLWHWNDKRKKKQLFSDKSKYLVLYNNINNDLVGFIHIQYDSDECDHTIPMIYLYEIQIQSNYNHQGIGTYLMNVLELLMHKLNLNKICLTVLKHNTSAVAFYTKLNYTVDESDPSTDHTSHTLEYQILSKINSRFTLPVTHKSNYI